MKRIVNKLFSVAHHAIELVIIFFSPAVMQIGIVVMAVLADTATGVWSAHKAGERITSKRLGDIVPKMFVYVMLILLAHTVQEGFHVSYARTMTAVGLTAIEMMSIDENFKKATGSGIFKPIINMLKRK